MTTDRTKKRPRQPVPSFDEFAQARWSVLYRTAYLLTGDRDAGQDLVQDTLIKAFKRWDQVTRSGVPEAYVRKMMLNEYLDDQRRRGRRALKDRLLSVREEPTIVPDPTDRLDLWVLLATLAPRERAVLVLRYYEDLTEDQIATVLSLSRGTVKSYASTALRSLRARQASATAEQVREEPR